MGVTNKNTMPDNAHLSGKTADGQMPQLFKKIVQKRAIHVASSEKTTSPIWMVSVRRTCFVLAVIAAFLGCALWIIAALEMPAYLDDIFDSNQLIEQNTSSPSQQAKTDSMQGGFHV